MPRRSSFTSGRWQGSRVIAVATGLVAFLLAFLVVRLPGVGGVVLAAATGVAVAVAAERSPRVGSLARIVLGALATFLSLVVVLWTVVGAGTTAQGCGLDTCDPQAGSLGGGLVVALAGGAISSGCTGLALWLLHVRRRRCLTVSAVVGISATTLGVILAVVGAVVAARHLS